MSEYPTNQAIAEKLRHISAAYELKGENRFRIIAYDKAADAVEHSTIELRDLWKEHKLEKVTGIGKNIASYLDEWFNTGKVKHFNKVTMNLPAAIFPLLDIPGFGPKRSKKLVTELRLTNPATVINDIEQAAKKGKIASIEGFGEKSQQDILEQIEEYKKGRSKSRRMNLPYAHRLAKNILTYMRNCPDIMRIEPLGSLRRKVSTIGDIDIAVASNNPKTVIDYFISYPGAERIIEKGKQTASVIAGGGNQIDLMVQPPKSFGSLLQHFTGSKQHNIHLREFALKKSLSLSEYGIRSQKTGTLQTFSSEEGFYKALDLEWIPPELRENRGEIEAAKKNSLPTLIELKDIHGDVHIHSDYDLSPSHDLGSSSLGQLIEKANEMGYEYIGITDHNPSLGNHTKEQICAIMRRRKEIFEHMMSSSKYTRVYIFIMLEIDIQSDGSLALPDAAFQYIDAAVVSIHSSFNQSRKEMTKRIIRGLTHKKARILGHPTGRILGQRKGIEADWNEIISFCRENDKAIEINAWPQRLDFPDVLVHMAIEKGARFTIDTDSHNVDNMDNMQYGIAVARRGWLSKRDVYNTLPYKKIKNWLVR